MVGSGTSVPSTSWPSRSASCFLRRFLLLSMRPTENDTIHLRICYSVFHTTWSFCYKNNIIVQLVSGPEPAKLFTNSFYCVAWHSFYFGVFQILVTISLFLAHLIEQYRYDKHLISANCLASSPAEEAFTPLA